MKPFLIVKAMCNIMCALINIKFGWTARCKLYICFKTVNHKNYVFFCKFIRKNRCKCILEIPNQELGKISTEKVTVIKLN